VRLDGLEADTAMALHAALAGLPARAAWRSLPEGAPAALDAFGAPSPALGLMRALRTALDPEGRFAAGRFHGGL
jgi:hypothetical protein